MKLLLDLNTKRRSLKLFEQQTFCTLLKNLGQQTLGNFGSALDRDRKGTIDIGNSSASRPPNVRRSSIFVKKSLEFFLISMLHSSFQRTSKVVPITSHWTHGPGLHIVTQL